ncbi:hypothetical protein Tco_0819278, partial [Tanacetum coccineum]
IIMAQQQHAADVHPDELCPKNKIYDLIDVNKKVDLDHMQCPPKSKILTNIIKNHPLRFSIAASSSVPWIYMAQTIFHLPQATDNNHNSFVPPPSFSEMVPFYKQVLEFTIELKTPSSFKTTGLLQPSQTLCKIFSKYYAELLWEGLYYSLHHPTSSIPYPRFTKIIIPAWMITDEMKQTEHYWMCTEVFRIDVPLTQSQPIESTHGTHRTTSAPRSPNPDKEAAESINVNDDDEEITDEVYELKRREKGKLVDGDMNYQSPQPLIRSPEYHIMPVSSDTEKLQELTDTPHTTSSLKSSSSIVEGLILERQKAKEETERLIAKAIMQERRNIQAQISTQIENAIANVIHSQVEASVRSYMSGHIFMFIPDSITNIQPVPDQQIKCKSAMKADPQLQQQDIAIWLALQMKFERNTVLQTACRTPAIRPRDQDDPYDMLIPEGEISAKRAEDIEYEAYVSGEVVAWTSFQEEQASIQL